MLLKTARYGIKICAACDAVSSYAWNMQIYKGKQKTEAAERNRGMRVVLDISHTTLPATTFFHLIQPETEASQKKAHNGCKNMKK